MIFSTMAIGFLGLIVWGHHMFVSGMNLVLSATFSLSTNVIVVPSAIKTFNWIGSIWKGSLRFPTVMCFALAFVSMFMKDQAAAPCVMISSLPFDRSFAG